MRTFRAVAASAAILVTGAFGAFAEEQDVWTYDATAKTISDGVWVLKVTEKNGELTIVSRSDASVVGTDMTLDLSKPVSDDKTIIAINCEYQLVPCYSTYLTKLVLPETLRAIGINSFMACSGLKTITPFMPASLTSISQQAFWLCNKLEGDLVLGVKGGDPLTLTGMNDFQGTKISSVTINADLSNGTLPKGIFSSCASLTNVVLRGSVTTISDSAFANSTKLTDLYASTFVTSWADNAFSGGPAAYAMRFWVDKTNPEWRTWIAANVTPWENLDGTKKDAYVANFGAGAEPPVGLVTRAGAQPANQWVMLWDQGGEPVLWPMEVSATGYEGMEDGEPHGITVTVTKPAGGLGCSYEWSADDGETWSTEPTNFVAAGVYTVTCRVTAEGFAPTNVSASVILHGGAADHWTYDPDAKTISDDVWVLNVTEKNGELSITGQNAATDLRSDMTLDLAKPVEGGKTIVAITGQIVPSYKTYLTTLILPETLRTIGNGVFTACSGLKTVTPFVPTSVVTVAQQAFWLCKNLEGDLVLGTKGGPELTIGRWAFNNATKITSVTIDADVKSGTLVTDAFSTCTSLTNVVLRGNVTTLSSAAFGGCSKLTDFYVSTFVTSWAADAITGPAAYKMRLWVDKTNPEWRAWIADDTKVLSWDGLDAVTKAKYDENFGTDAPRPAGLVTGTDAQPASQWVMLWDQGGEPVLWPMEVSATGYEGLVDGQPHNIAVTVTKPVGGAGCSYEWSLDGGETWSDKLPNLTEAGVYTVTCRVSAEDFESTEVSATVILHGPAADHWTYDPVAKTISDDVWVFNVTEKNGELSITDRNEATDIRSGMTLDLTKPIDGGLSIVAINNPICPTYTSYLTVVKLPETLRSIASGCVFCACNGLTTVTPFLPASLTSIGQQAFWLSKNLEGDLVVGVKGGDPITFGGMLIFSGTKISSATIEADVKGGTLPQSIFSSCTSLTNVVLRGKVTAVAATAFSGCKNLKDLYLNAFVTSWAADAFSNGPADYAMRLWVDMYGKEWDAWIAENVTPWNELDGETQALYYANFGAGAKRPVGLVTKEGAQFANQWVLRWYPNGPKPGFMLLLK